MNKILAYWNRYIVNEDFDLRPTLRYKDVKDIPIFIATVNYYWPKKVKSIVALYDPTQILYKSKDMIQITLEEALRLYKERPELFKREELKRLYSYIAFYDPNILEKIKQRVEKHGIHNLL